MSWDALAVRVAAAHRAASGERTLRKIIGAHETTIHNRVYIDPSSGAPCYGTDFKDGAPVHVRLPGVTHQFREDQVDELERFIAAVDAELSKPEYRIRRSVELENAIILRKPAPEKVAVKMILLRIQKIQKQVKEINESVQMNLESHAGSGRAFPSDMLTFTPGVPTDGGREALYEYMGLCTKPSDPQYRRPAAPYLQDLKKVLARPEVTDAVVEEAMNISKVEEVMLS